MDIDCLHGFGFLPQRACGVYDLSLGSIKVFASYFREKNVNTINARVRMVTTDNALNKEAFPNVLKEQTETFTKDRIRCSYN